MQFIGFRESLAIAAVAIGLAVPARAMDFQMSIANASPWSIGLTQTVTCSQYFKCPYLYSIGANSVVNFAVGGKDDQIYAFLAFDYGAYVNGVNYNCHFNVSVGPTYVANTCPQISAAPPLKTSGTASSPVCTAVVAKQATYPQCSDGSVVITYNK